MAEYRLFTGTTAHVSTAAFHAGRERAPHLDQPDHKARLLRCAEGIDAWGYDFQPANQPAWAERGVTAELRDVFNRRDVPRWGELAVCAEVLEHLTDPHSAVTWIADNARYIVASSPHGETDQHHTDCHAWAWDFNGYRDLIEPHFEILTHETVDWSQLITGRSRRL